MNEQENINKIRDYIKSGEKKREDFSIGVEMEHFTISNEDGKSISYYGENGVGETLDFLKEKYGFKAAQENGYTLSLDSDLVDVSTEPGSQFEIAIKAQRTVADLEKIYLDFMSKVLEHIEEKDQSLVALGYHPVTKIEDIKILPKKRYDHMFNYFKSQGNMAHNMMKGTASVQTTIDFENEEDFKRKYFLLNVFTPVFYAMFDNAFIFQGNPTKLHTIRQKIWENTDVDRSGLFEIAFDEDLSYEKYARKIWNTPTIFRPEGKGTVSTGNKTLKEVAEEVELDDELIFHALSIVFPDIRVKKYIEVRMFDAVSYPLNFSIPAFIKGLFYDEDNLKKLYELGKNTSYDEALKAKSDIIDQGLEAKYLGKTLKELSKILFEMSYNGLDEGDRKYLEPLRPFVENSITPRDEFEKIYKKDGILKAIDSVKIKPEA